MPSAAIPTTPNASELFGIEAVNLGVECNYTDVSIRPQSTTRAGLVTMFAVTLTRGEDEPITLELQRDEVLDLSRAILAVL